MHKIYLIISDIVQRWLNEIVLSVTHYTKMLLFCNLLKKIKKN